MKADKAADASTAVKPATSEARLELRSSVGHDGVKPVMGEATGSRLSRDQMRTADASGATSAPATMTDASSSAANMAASAPPRAEAKSESATAGAEPAAAKPDQAAPSDTQLVESKASEAAIAEIKPAGTEAADRTEKKPDQPAEASSADVTAEAPATERAKPDDSVSTATDARPVASDEKKDQTRLPNAEKAVVAKPEPPKPAGRIAVLVSRKDGKLYVRENFKPLFDVPVTIAPSDRLLGTHVFTARSTRTTPMGCAGRWSRCRCRRATRRRTTTTSVRRGGAGSQAWCRPR